MYCTMDAYPGIVRGTGTGVIRVKNVIRSNTRQQFEKGSSDRASGIPQFPVKSYRDDTVVRPATAATNSPGGSPRLGPGTPTHGNSECVLLEQPY